MALKIPHIALAAVLLVPLAVPDPVDRPLALWLSIKYELLSSRGQEYFNSSFEGAMVPAGVDGVDMFKATVLSVSPISKPSVLVASIVDRKTPEITLKVKDTLGRVQALNRTVPIGAKIWFRGTPVLFSKHPFMITFDVLGENVRFERP